MNPFDWGNAIVAFITGKYDDQFTALASALNGNAVLPVALFKLEWFKTQLGATVGLAIALFPIATLIASLVIMLNFRKPASDIPMTGRLFQSMWLLTFFIVGVYPALYLALQLSAVVKDVVIRFMTQLPTPDMGTGFNLITTSLPQDPTLMIGAKAVFLILGFILWVESTIIMVVTPFAILVWPVAVILRVFGGWLDKLFLTLSVGIMIGLVAPPVMAGVVLFPVAISKIPLFGSMQLVQFIAGVIGLGGAIMAPFTIKKWSEPRLQQMFGQVKVFGKVDATVRGGSLSTRSTAQPSRSSGSSGSGSAFGAFGKSMAVGGATVGLTSRSPQEFRQKITHVGADAAAAGLMVAGQPALAAVIQGVDTSARVREDNDKRLAHAKAAAEVAAANTAAAVTAAQTSPSNAPAATAAAQAPASPPSPPPATPASPTTP